MCTSMFGGSLSGRELISCTVDDPLMLPASVVPLPDSTVCNDAHACLVLGGCASGPQRHAAVRTRIARAASDQTRVLLCPWQVPVRHRTATCLRRLGIRPAPAWVREAMVEVAAHATVRVGDQGAREHNAGDPPSGSRDRQVADSMNQYSPPDFRLGRSSTFPRHYEQAGPHVGQTCCSATLLVASWNDFMSEDQRATRVPIALT